MAWTTSAGPQESFALPAEAETSGFAARLSRIVRPDPSRSGKPLLLATTAHLAGLGIVAPMISEQPVVVLPVLIGLAISCISLARPPAAAPRLDAANDDFTGPAAVAASVVLPANIAATARPAPTAEPEISTAIVSEGLRADLMSRVSHELRTPLNAVMGFTDLMSSQMFGPLGHPRYEEYVGHIRESSQRLLKSAEDTLAVTSLVTRSTSANERESLDLSAIARDARTAVADAATHQALQISIDDSADVEVVANRRALRQSIVNVLTEAVARAAHGAEITIQASRRGTRVSVTVSLDRQRTREGEDACRSLPICLARALMELDGGQLVEKSEVCGRWSATMTLEHACQTDLFSRLATA